MNATRRWTLMIVIALIIAPMAAVTPVAAYDNPLPIEWEKDLLVGVYNASDPPKFANPAGGVEGTNDGGVLIYGPYGTVESPSFGGVLSEGLLLVKYDSDGVEEWRTTVNQSELLSFRQLSETNSGNFILVGQHRVVLSDNQIDRDARVMMLDSSGAVIWIRDYGDEYAETNVSDFAETVTSTNDGGAVFIGLTQLSSDGSSVRNWMVRIDSAGNELWNRTLDFPVGGGIGVPYSLISLPSGGFSYAQNVPGQTYPWNRKIVTVNDSGIEVWNHTFTGKPYFPRGESKGLVQTTDGGFALGSAIQLSSFEFVAHIDRLNATGDVQWRQDYDGGAKAKSTSLPGGLVANDDGSVVFAGNYQYSGNFTVRSWLGVVEKDGTQRWAQTYTPSADSQRVSSVMISPTADGGLAYRAIDDFDAAWLVKFEDHEVTTNKPPVALYNFNPDNPLANEEVTFNGSDSFDADGTISQYAWDFDGDGENHTFGEVVTHRFSSGGEYEVTLTVTDDDGASNTTTQIIQVAFSAIIDVRPGDDVAAINPNDKGVVTVAVINSSTLDVHDINTTTLRFGDPEDVTRGGSAGAEAVNLHYEDVDSDGEVDLVVQFPTQDTRFEGDETTAVLVGQTNGGHHLEGSDSVKLVGKD